jgi:hypothetical protein
VLTTEVLITEIPAKEKLGSLTGDPNYAPMGGM